MPGLGRDDQVEAPVRSFPVLEAAHLDLQALAASHLGHPGVVLDAQNLTAALNEESAGDAGPAAHIEHSADAWDQEILDQPGRIARTGAVVLLGALSERARPLRILEHQRLSVLPEPTGCTGGPPPFGHWAAVRLRPRVQTVARRTATGIWGGNIPESWIVKRVVKDRIEAPERGTQEVMIEMLMRFDPFRELNRLTASLGTAARTAVMPMDAYRQGDQFVVQLDLPGVNPESIDLTVEKNVLTVSAERSWQSEEARDVVVAERPQGQFSRQLFLAESLDPERIEAHYDQGVLTLTVPVAEQAKLRKVEINAGGGAKALEAESKAA